MMGIKDKLSQTLATATEKGTEMAGKAKTKLEITNKKGTVKDKYKKIGELIYAAREDDRDVTEEVQTICDEIDLLFEEIQMLEESL